MPGLLCAIIIADALANLIVNMAGMTGSVKFLVNFILYAAIFFAVLYAIEKLLGIEFFGFGRNQYLPDTVDKSRHTTRFAHFFPEIIFGDRMRVRYQHKSGISLFL